MSATPARRIAHGILVELDAGAPPLPQLLGQPQVEALDPRERAFLHELVLGTLRLRGTLDHALTRLIDRPLRRLDPPTLAALRLGAHQILHLRVPQRAAVSESVALLAGRPGGGFVNAVLRRLCREGPPVAPDPGRDPRGWLTTAGSLPGWLADRWIERLGADVAVARARALSTAPDTFFRFHPGADTPLRIAAAGIEWESTAVPDCLRLTSGRVTELAREGLLYVQDLGSQLIARLASRTGPVLDACAAPGGKTLLLWDLGQARPIVATDSSRPRLETLRHQVRSWGAAPLVVAADGRQPPFRAIFDGVLLDAPCSGLGTIARHPDIRWRLSAEDLAGQARRQLELLEASAALVRPGGSLVYATCSLEAEETTDVVATFLAGSPAWQRAPVPDWAQHYSQGPDVVVLPERDGSDGFFAVLLERR